MYTQLYHLHKLALGNPGTTNQGPDVTPLDQLNKHLQNGRAQQARDKLISQLVPASLQWYHRGMLTARKDPKLSGKLPTYQQTISTYKKYPSGTNTTQQTIAPKVSNDLTVRQDLTTQQQSTDNYAAGYWTPDTFLNYLREPLDTPLMYGVYSALGKTPTAVQQQTSTPQKLTSVIPPDYQDDTQSIVDAAQLNGVEGPLIPGVDPFIEPPVESSLNIEAYLDSRENNKPQLIPKYTDPTANNPALGMGGTGSQQHRNDHMPVISLQQLLQRQQQYAPAKVAQPAAQQTATTPTQKPKKEFQLGDIGQYLPLMLLFLPMLMMRQNNNMGIQMPMMQQNMDYRGY